jgi:uncharacterized protein (TIGR02246 family)
MASDRPSSPRAVHQDLLDRTGQAYRDNDFDAFAACFLLPQHVATHDGSRHLQTRDDLLAMFTSMRAFFAEKGATHLDRRSQAADHDGPDTIRATHESRLMAGDRVVQTAYPAYSILKRHEGVWKVAFSQYVVDTDQSGALGALAPAPAPISGESE